MVEYEYCPECKEHYCDQEILTRKKCVNCAKEE